MTSSDISSTTLYLGRGFFSSHLERSDFEYKRFLNHDCGLYSIKDRFGYKEIMSGKVF